MANKDIPIEVLFKCLHQDYKNLQIRLGQEMAYNDEQETYIQELERKLHAKKQVENEEKKLKKLMQPSKEECRQLRKEIKEQEMYKTLKDRYDRLRKEIKEQEMYKTLKDRYDRLHNQYREATKVRDELINKVVVLENKIKELEHDTQGN